MKNPPVIAIDIGNTNTNIGLIDTHTLTCGKMYTFSSVNCSENIINKIEEIKISHQTINQFSVKISTVIKSILHDVIEKCSLIPDIDPISHCKNNKNLPIKINYDKPELLGTDRIANCLFGYKKYPGEDLIIVDAGTAITIDFLSSSGEFEGGFILPGPRMQLNSLYTKTSELPQTKITSDSVQFPANSTEKAITGGVSYGTAGGISFIVKNFYKKLSGNIRILTCGGAWKTIENLIDFDYEYLPEMTLIGIGLFEN